MEKYLPWIAVVMAPASYAVCLGFGPKNTEAPSLMQALRKGLYFLIACAILAAVAVFCGFRYGKAVNGLLPGSLGFAIGALGVYLAHLVGTSTKHSAWSTACTFAFPTAALATLHWFKGADTIPDAQLGLVIGGMVAAFLFGIGEDDDSRRSAGTAAMFMAVLMAANYMGRFAAGGNLSMTGVAFGVVATIAAVAAALVSSKLGSAEARQNGFAWIATAVIVLVLGAVAIAARKFFSVADIRPIFAASVLLGLVVHWLIPEESTGATRFAIGAAIWLAAATAVFTMRKGYGMSICLAGGFTVLALVGNRKAMLTLAPLAALVFYRLFTETYSDWSFGPEVGPHYAMVGLLTGAVLPLILVEWLEGPHDRMAGKGVCAGFVLSLLAVGVPLAGAILYGPRGVVGYLVGLGLAPVVQGLKGVKSATGLSVAMGLAAAMTLTYYMLGDTVDMAREPKVALLSRLFLDIVAAALLVAYLSRIKGEKRSA